MSSQRLIACQEGDKLKMDISHMKKLLIATALLSVSAGSMAAVGSSENVVLSEQVTVAESCGIELKSVDLKTISAADAEFTIQNVGNVPFKTLTNNGGVTIDGSKDVDISVVVVGGSDLSGAKNLASGANSKLTWAGDFGDKLNAAGTHEVKATLEVTCGQ